MLMELIKKIIRKTREGMIKEMYHEFLWIYHYGLHYKFEILWYIVLGIFTTGMSLGGSVVSKYIIDAVTGHDTKGIIPAAIFYVGMQLFRIISNALTNRISTRIEIKVDQEIRADVYDKIMIADWEALSEYHSGDLMTRVDSDVSNISRSVISWVPNFITETVEFLGTLGIILYYDSTLAGLALLSAPVTILVSRYMMTKMRIYNQKLREVSSEVTTFHEESFQNIQVIKSFGLTKLYGRKMRQVQEKYRNMRLEYNQFSIMTTMLMSLVGTVVTVVCFGWGVYRLWSGVITYGTMTLFLEMSDSLSASFSSLIYMVPGAISAATAAGRIMAVTDLPRENFEGEEEIEQMLEANRDGGVSISMEEVTFHYAGGTPVYSNVNLEAHPDEIVALVGPSGEGKTTTLRLFLGIINPQAGAALVTGETTGEVRKLTPSTRRFFTYVPQGNTMFAGTIAENLRMMKQNATDEEMWQALKLACAYDFVAKLPDGLNSRMKERGGGFSEGQIQRISIARALLADVPVLLLDEATSALDVVTERKVLRNIMHSEYKRTCIVTTHRPSVLGICNRVYRISGGSVQMVSEEEIQQMMMDWA